MTDTQDTSATAASAAARALELVRRIAAADPRGTVLYDGEVAGDWEHEAKAIVAALDGRTVSTITLVRRDYRAPDGHQPYQGIFHDAKDEHVDPSRLFSSNWNDGVKDPGLLSRAGVEDGDEFEMTIRRTGRRPFGDRKYLLVAPGRYRPETEAETAFRLKEGRPWNYREDAPLE